uniref:Teratocyte cystatin-like n=1 Tax=Cotesia flavipes TaxID=89805 RepID=A0A8K1YTV4_COTFL|nr:teratocyte cystatin-like [Cotesia flavipes]
MYLKNLTSKLVFLVVILQINSIFAGPTTKWQRLDTDSKEAIHLAQKALNQYISQFYPGSQQMIVTNISSVEINLDTKEFFVNAKFEESDCSRGNYSATCKILKNGLHSTCHFQGVDNNPEEYNFDSLNCQGNSASLPMATSNLFLNPMQMQDMFVKPIPVPNFFPQNNGNSNPFNFYNIDEAFWNNFGPQ